jgi:hypothetical protein
MRPAEADAGRMHVCFVIAFLTKANYRHRCHRVNLLQNGAVFTDPHGCKVGISDT